MNAFLSGFQSELLKLASPTEPNEPGLGANSFDAAARRLHSKTSIKSTVPQAITPDKARVGAFSPRTTPMRMRGPAT